MKNIGTTTKDRPGTTSSTPPPAELQLTNLSSVLNGLQHGASAMQQHVSQAMAAIKAGTYKVDASAVSRLLISESLGSKASSTEED